MSAKIPIGIDLGTTNSCVAVMRNGQVEVIVNEQGNFITPSIVAFNEHESFVGDAAKDQILLNPENTVFDVKRMIGRKFDDAAMQSDMKNWPFTVLKGEDGEPRVDVMFKNERKSYAPEELMAMILYHLKTMAEKHLGQDVHDAVITVPAYFNHIQRQATINAGIIAGLNVIGIINEPTAAAIAHRHLDADEFEDADHILVYDLGGGTFDVSVLNVSGEETTVLATNGDPHLGGEDFDCALVEYCVQEFKRKNKIDFSGNKPALRRLRATCEMAKLCLSTGMAKEIVVDTLANGIIFTNTISRSKFEYINLKRFCATLDLVKKTLNEAELKKEDIDRVVLVGGSTKIPKIQKLLREFFEDDCLDFVTVPEDSVACGAAVHAAMMRGGQVGKQNSKLFQDIVTISLGYDLRNADGHLRTRSVIPKNTPLPVSVMHASRTRKSNQKRSVFTFRQGESTVPSRNYNVGDLRVDNLPPSPARSLIFHTTFVINTNGILSATATEKRTRKSRSIGAESLSNGPRSKRLEQMIEEAKKYQLGQQERQKTLKAIEALEEQCLDVQRSIIDAENSGSGSAIIKSVLVKKCDDTLQWIQDNPFEPHDFYTKRHTEFDAQTMPLLKK